MAAGTGTGTGSGTGLCAGVADIGASKPRLDAIGSSMRSDRQAAVLAEREEK